jgi:hypothetical protein
MLLRNGKPRGNRRLWHHVPEFVAISGNLSVCIVKSSADDMTSGD